MKGAKPWIAGGELADELEARGMTRETAKTATAELEAAAALDTDHTKLAWIAKSQTLTCALCARRAVVRGPKGRDAAQAAGWRWSLNGKTAWCGEHADEALSGRDARW
jgi:hypothetical protein